MQEKTTLEIWRGFFDCKEEGMQSFISHNAFLKVLSLSVRLLKRKDLYWLLYCFTLKNICFTFKIMLKFVVNDNILINYVKI